MSHGHPPSNFPWSARWKPEPNRQPLSFMGYHRPDGRVGTRNYWLVMSLAPVDREQLGLFQEALLTVLGYQCPNSYERHLRDLREQYRAGSYFETSSLIPPVKPVLKPLFVNVDGIKFLSTHENSAGDVSDRDSFLDRVAEYCMHANVGGVTVLSGGGPDGAVHTLRRLIDQHDPAFDKPLLVVDRATYGADRAWLTAATNETFRGMALVNKQTRRSAPLSRLVIGTQQGETNESLLNQVVDECVQFMASVGTTVLLARPDESAGSQRAQLISRTREETNTLTPLTVFGCTLQLTQPGVGFPLENPLAPIISLSSENELAQPGEPLLRYLLKLASGELRTPSERDAIV